MSKLILKPGNGVNYPKQGYYVKIHLVIKSKTNDILYDSNRVSILEFRIGDNYSNLIEPIADLIAEMSLFEKCSIEFSKENQNDFDRYNLTDNLVDLINQHEKIFFEIEILDISINKFS